MKNLFLFLLNESVNYYKTPPEILNFLDQMQITSKKMDDDTILQVLALLCTRFL